MRFVIGAVGVLLAFSGCTRIGTQKDAVGAAIYKTETLARAFTYTERSDKETVVRGAIADDYRYRLTATVNARTFAAEVVRDDARAVRTSDARWVVDPKGANNLWNQTPVNYVQGKFPTYDALNILKYTRSAMAEASDVVLFNPEGQAYRKKLDPFPRPTAGLIRYDVIAPALKPRDQSSSLQSSQIPGPRFFRQMALYVRDGAIVEIREQISVYKTLIDPRSHLATRIGDYNITLPAGSPHEQAAYVRDALSLTAERLGQPPLRERTLDVVFENLGRPANVEVPSGAVKGSLLGAANFGQTLFERPG